MHRFSEQQARIGAFLGNGANFITEKTALTRAQGLMLAMFAAGAVVVGYTATHLPSASQPDTKVAEAKTAPNAEATSATPAPSSAPQPVPSDHAFSPMTPAESGAGPAAANPNVASAPVANLVSADDRSATVVPATPATAAASAPPPAATASPSALDAVVLARIESLAKDMARISQKLDDVVAKQRQTTARLNGFITDSKQAHVTRNDDDAKPEPAPRKVGPTRKAAPTAAAGAPLTVHRTRAAHVDRHREAELRRDVLAKAIVIDHARIAEHRRLLHRRRAALARATIFGAPLHIGRW